MRETSTDVLIAGGGTGGCAAAMAACALGMRVVMTEETAWVGGQLTSQAVPPDEHPWIEQFGCTATYRQYRELVRAFYRDRLPLSPGARSNRRLNPGSGWVSRLCHEPRIGWLVLQSMLQAPVSLGLLDLRLHRRPVSADVDGDCVRSVAFLNTQTGQREIVHAKYVLDATELGDLLPMTGTEYVLGAESKSETQEPHALDGEPEPENVQGITWCFALAHEPGADHRIDRPAEYEKWRGYQPAWSPTPLLSFEYWRADAQEMRSFPLFGKDEKDWFTLFKYRQIVDPGHFLEGYAPLAATIANWPQNDYYEATILDVPADVQSQRLESAKQLSLSVLYWLQNEAPRHDGGVGYPGLRMVPSVVGTDDGFAMAPYIRESRRIRARFTVLEQHVASYTNPGCDRAPSFYDSVGVGSYRIDLHPAANGRNSIDTSTFPFEIPLGALLPVRMRNLLPACKNLGVTHITNGCYRLHPVEWNIGEAAGALAAFCLSQRVEPSQVREDPGRLSAFQSMLVDLGVELSWPQLRAL